MTRSGLTGPRARFARRIATSDDRGVSLIFALLFITVVALVIGVVLAYVQTAVRGNTTERAIAAQQAAADGAGQIAVNNIRNSTYTLDSQSDCLGSNGTLNLRSFYTGTTTYTATIKCTLDPEDSTSGSNGSTGGNPANAILTLDKTNNNGVHGVVLTADGSSSQFKVDGSVFSNSDIDTNRLNVDSAMTARGDCTGTIVADPKRCDYGNTTNHAGDDPDYGTPFYFLVGGASVPNCPGPGNGSGSIVTLYPGVYDDNDLAGLNRLTNGTCQATIWFSPGTYYFDLGGAWTIKSGYVVGGTTTTQVRSGHTPTMPGACYSSYQNPSPFGGFPLPGVEFVMGGTSRIAVDGGSIELCGSPTFNGPPIALYGLKQDLGGFGSPQVPAESGCIIAPSNPCPVLSSTTNTSSRIYIDGTTYVPQATIDVNLSNRSGQLFGYGVIAKRLEVDATSTAVLSDPVISGPSTSPAVAGNTVVFLDVYVCTKQGNGQQPTQCPTTDGAKPALQAKVGFVDPTGQVRSGRREVTVYNWSTQRD